MNNESYYVSSLNLQEEMPIKLWETYSDADLKSLSTPGPAGIHSGMMKFVNCHMAKYTGELKNTVVLCGPAFVQLFCNRSGSAMVQGALAQLGDLATITATSGSTTTFTTGTTLVADELVGDFLSIYDDAGAAGAAPEGETRQIIKNTANTITVQPPFTVAVAVGDTGYVVTQGNVIASAVGAPKGLLAGVVLAPDGVADNYWGWFCRWGTVGLLGKAATVIAKRKALIADVGRVTVSAGAAYDLMVGYAVSALATDSVSDMFLANIDCMTSLYTHS